MSESMELELLKYFLMTRSTDLETRFNGYQKLLPIVKENGMTMY
jgi:hypothetical protein